SAVVGGGIVTEEDAISGDSAGVREIHNARANSGGVDVALADNQIAGRCDQSAAVVVDVGTFQANIEISFDRNGVLVAAGRRQKNDFVAVECTLIDRNHSPAAPRAARGSRSNSNPNRAGCAEETIERPVRTAACRSG